MRKNKEYRGEESPPKTERNSGEMEQIIVKKMVEDGLMAKAIITELKEDSCSARIGVYEIPFRVRENHKKSNGEIPFGALVEAIKESLDFLRTSPGYNHRYLYCYNYLCENI